MNRWVLATASVIMMAGLGSFNAWSVFRQPLSEFYDANIINTTAGLAILSEAQPMATSISGASTALAAAFVVTISVTDAVGRLLWPALSDKIGGRTVFLAMFSLQAMAFLLMPTLAVGSFVVFCGS